MPELPDIHVYLRAIGDRVIGQPLHAVRLGNPFVLRTVSPAPADLVGRTVVGTRRLGKRIVLALDDDLFVVIHLMIAGRLHWRARGVGLGGRTNIAAFDFPNGTLLLTEAGTKKRASLQLLRGEDALQALDPGGLEVLDCDPGAFAEALTRENHTLKRALTDPRLFSGIGNSYSDEILHRARISPAKLTQRLTSEEIGGLRKAVQDVLTEWTARLERDADGGFPEKVTAFRPEMAVHGKYGMPCPVCGSPVQRIVYADNESNYCATCQTDGKLLADRSLSRLLKSDWPRTLAELEERRQR